MYLFRTGSAGEGEWEAAEREVNSDAVAHEAAGKAGLSQQEGLWWQRHQSEAIEEERGREKNGGRREHQRKEARQRKGDSEVGGNRSKSPSQCPSHGKGQWC